MYRFLITTNIFFFFKCEVEKYLVLLPPGWRECPVRSHQVRLGDNGLDLTIIPSHFMPINIQLVCKIGRSDLVDTNYQFYFSQDPGLSAGTLEQFSNEEISEFKVCWATAWQLIQQLQVRSSWQLERQENNQLWNCIKIFPFTVLLMCLIL